MNLFELSGRFSGESASSRSGSPPPPGRPSADLGDLFIPAGFASSCVLRLAVSFFTYLRFSILDYWRPAVLDPSRDTEILIASSLLPLSYGNEKEKKNRRRRHALYSQNERTARSVGVHVGSEIRREQLRPARREPGPTRESRWPALFSSPFVFHDSFYFFPLCEMTGASLD